MPQEGAPDDPLTTWELERTDPFEVPSLDDAPDWQKTVRVLVEQGADLMESEPVSTQHLSIVFGKMSHTTNRMALHSTTSAFEEPLHSYPSLSKPVLMFMHFG